MLHIVGFSTVVVGLLVSGCVQYTGPERRLFLVTGGHYLAWEEESDHDRLSDVIPSPNMVAREAAFERRPTAELAYKLASFYAPFDIKGIYPAHVDRMTRAYELLVFAAVNGHRPAVLAVASIFEDGPMDHRVDKDTASCLYSAAKITYGPAVASATVACGTIFDSFSPVRLPPRLRPLPLTIAAP